MASLHERRAYEAGYLRGTIETTILRLPHDTPEQIAAFLRESLDRVGRVQL